jgi:pantoate--beta-alanine ligase
LDLVSDIKILREKCNLIRKQDKKIAFVPTMGSLHRGHLSLVEKAALIGDVSIVSIFVNPMQFGPTEDFEIYPRQDDKDISLLDSNNVNILYLPSKGLIYPNGFQTRVSVCNLEKKLCGEFRPTHFEGVATVVSKLLLQVMPDYAVFGEKDYQQLVIIKQLVSDLNIPTNVVGCPIVREKDGLAMSSRNILLNDKERNIAPNLYYQLQQIVKAVNKGDEVNSACKRAAVALKKIGFTSVDYIKVCDSIDLEQLDAINNQARVFGAASINGTRLIDNLSI